MNKVLKIIRTIESCKTIDQLTAASNWSRDVWERLDRNMDDFNLQLAPLIHYQGHQIQRDQGLNYVAESLELSQNFLQ